MKRKLALGLLLLALAFLFLFLFRSSWLSAIGRSVMAQDEFGKAEVAVVLNSTFPKGILEAADLYSEGKVGTILLMKERVPDGFEEFSKRGLQVSDAQTFQFDLLQKLKVAERDIFLSTIVCESTRQEAFALKTFLDEHPSLKNIVIIGRKPQTRRTKALMRRILPSEVSIFVRASRHERLTDRNWWKDTWYLREISEELLKDIYAGIKSLLPLPAR
jgi:hypothetical protein